MTIGEKIRQARKSKGYTQEELGKLIGVKKSAVAKYENGIVVNFKRNILLLIAKELDMSISDLTISDDENLTGAEAELAKIFSDSDLKKMISEYNQLSEIKKAQVREYVHLLLKVEN